MPASVLLDWQDNTAILTLNRPDRLNALDDVMARELFAAVQTLEHHPSLRCLIIQGAGTAFMAGGDVRMFGRLLDMDEETRHAAVMDVMADVHGAIDTIYDLPVPVIARVHGDVAGFGLSLIAACDLAVCADNARFSPAYTAMGITPDGGCTWFLPRLIGMKRAMEVLLLGEEFAAARALELGIVNRVVPAADCEAEVRKMARRIVQGPPVVQGQLKRLLHDGSNATRAVQMQAEAYHFIYGVENPEFAAAVRAFLAGRDVG